MSAENDRLMEPLRLAGRIIMENGGETFRAEETVLRMGRALGLEGLDCFAIPTGLFISFRGNDGSSVSSVTRIHRGGTDMLRVNEVNSISRGVSSGEMSADEAAEHLRAAMELEDPGLRRAMVPAAALCGAGFAVMFGGGWAELLVAAAVTALVQGLSMVLEERRAQSLVCTLIGAFLSALLPMLLRLCGLPLALDTTVAGCLMPLLPGLAMTNAVQDAIRGDMMSGLSHGLSALMTAGMIACGTLVASGLIDVLTGGGLG